MSSAESTRRLRHIGLISHQRRLRHLWSLSARNISQERSELGTESLMETYFTLHISRSGEAFYTSEKIQDSLNPTWRSFDLSRSCPEVDTSRSSFYVKVWGGGADDFRLIIEWKVDLKGLYFVGSKIHKDGVRYQPNSILFGIFDGFYSSADNLQESSKNRAKFCKSWEVEQNSAILTYNTYSLARLHTTQRAIKQTEVTVGKVRCSIIQKLSDASTRTQLCSKKEGLELRLILLKEEIQSQRKRLERETEVYDHHTQQVQSQAEKNRSRWEELHRFREDLEEQRKKLIEERDIERQVIAMYTKRQATLVKELSHIYPIAQPTNPNHLLAICSAVLPNAETNIQMGKDDPTISTALGHTSHVILMISRFLQVPLRYPIMYNGSRSSIHDHITEPLADKDRDFPLFTRGKEKFHYNYAVYLLNRNIAQLRFVLGLPTSDLRLTLPNLQSLLEYRWGVVMPPGLNPQPAGSPSVSVQRPRASIGVQASMASPYMSPNPPHYLSSRSASVPAGMLADTIPNSPPPAYHISEAAQQRGRGRDGQVPPHPTTTTTTGTHQGRRGTGGLRDSGVIVTEGEEVVGGSEGNASGEVNGDRRGEEERELGRTGEEGPIPNGADSGEDEEEEGEEVRAEDIGISQPNYNSGDALSQDSLDIGASPIGASSSNTSPTKNNLPSSDIVTKNDVWEGTSASSAVDSRTVSAGFAHNQSNSNNASQIPGKSATHSDDHSSQSIGQRDGTRRDGQLSGDPLGLTDDYEMSRGEVPFMAVDRIFKFDDITSRADALTNPGSFSSFKSNNSSSMNKTQGVSKS